MGTRHQRTLYEVHLAGNHLKATCADCNHRKIFDAGRLWWLYTRRGWSDALHAVPQHLFCSECRGRRIAVAITFEAPTGRQPLGPTDREWKAHVRDTRR